MCVATRPRHPYRKGVKSDATAAESSLAKISKKPKRLSRQRTKPEPAHRDGYSMLVSPSKSKILRPYVECIAGPILITAPHGLKLAGPRRKHLREKHTSELVLLLAKALKKHLPGYPSASFIGRRLSLDEVS